MDPTWPTIEEAATQIGVSTKTVRRYLRDGKLTGAQHPGRYGPQWRIDPQSLATLDAYGQHHGQQIEIIPPDHAGTPVQIIDRLTTTITELQEELREQRTTIQHMAEDLTQMRAALDRLAPPRRGWWPWPRRDR